MGHLRLHNQQQRHVGRSRAQQQRAPAIEQVTQHLSVVNRKQNGIADQAVKITIAEAANMLPGWQRRHTVFNA